MNKKAALDETGVLYFCNGLWRNASAKLINWQFPNRAPTADHGRSVALSQLGTLFTPVARACIALGSEGGLKLRLPSFRPPCPTMTLEAVTWEVRP